MKRFLVVVGVWLVSLAWVLAGVSPVSASARESVRPAAAAAASSVDTPGGFTSLAPIRLLDTRNALGVSTTTPVAAGGTLTLQVLDEGGVPVTGVSAVVLNVTVTQPTSSGYITAYADGTTRPNASNLNFVANQTVPNLLIAPVGANGKVALFNGSAGTVHLLGDVNGYFRSGTPTEAGAFGALAPARLLDTRSATGRPGTTPVPAGGIVSLQVAGQGGVPGSGVSAVVLNVTVTAPTGGGYITTYADGTTRPNASNLNFTPGQTVPNLVIAPVGANGKVALYNGSTGTVHLLGDVTGYFRAGAPTVAGAFGALAPSRLLDTRGGIGRPGTTPVAAGGVVSLQVAGQGGVPATGVSAVVMNVTVTAPTAGGFITAYADAATRPNASNLNFAPNQTVPNLVIVPVGVNGKVSLFNGSGGTVHLLGDVTGWFRAGSAGSGAIAGTVTDAVSPNHGLAGVSVSASSTAAGGYSEATTDTNGAYVLYDLPPASDYQVCFFPYGATGGGADASGYLPECYNNVAVDATPTPVTVSADTTTSAINAGLARAGAISGKVTDSGGTPKALANVYVYVNSPSTDNSRYVITDAGGNYTVPGLPAAADYRVCFDPSAGTGGSSDALGYVAECWNDQPVAGTPTPVTVTLGATATGKNAAVATGGSVAGTVTDANGTHHALTGVFVDVWSPSLQNGSYALTEADGTYVVKGLPTASDYRVCFYGSDATGGSTDDRGYRDECFNDKAPASPDPQTMTAGTAKTGFSAALSEAGALSGTVTESGGTQHGLANVFVEVTSASQDARYTAFTDDNGAYTVRGLYGGSDYHVCFSDFGATGGASDDTGYQSECFNNQPTGTPTNVTVVPGATRGGVDGSLDAKAGAAAARSAAAPKAAQPEPPARAVPPAGPYAEHPEIGHSYPGGPKP